MEYTEDMLTEWFDVERSKPTVDGVYEVLYETREETPTYSLFENGFWHFLSFHPFYAVEHGSGFITNHKVSHWRGLKTPSAPKKKHSGNKKKTMWIVSAWVNGGETYKHVGAFENHENAVNAAKRYKQPRINKVRFRTPEA